MKKDAQWSHGIFHIARSTISLRDTAIFCASHLIWLVAGFGIGRVFPNLFLLIPIIFLPWGVSLLLSEFIRRPRPFHAEGHKPLIHLFVETPSFPSSHSTLAFAFVAAFIGDPLVWPFLLVGACFVALGRVAVGVHYLSDVVVGALIGFGLGYAMRVAMLLFFV